MWSSLLRLSEKYSACSFHEELHLSEASAGVALAAEAAVNQATYEGQEEHATDKGQGTGTTIGGQDRLGQGKLDFERFNVGAIVRTTGLEIVVVSREGGSARNACGARFTIEFAVFHRQRSVWSLLHNERLTRANRDGVASHCDTSCAVLVQGETLN